MSEKVIALGLSKKERKRIKQEVLQGIDKALADIEAAESFFQNTTDFKLTEVAIFYKQAAITRYEYLLKQAKAYGIAIDAGYMLQKGFIRALE